MPSRASHNASRRRHQAAAATIPVEGQRPQARTLGGTHYVPVVSLDHRCRRDLPFCQYGYRPDRTESWVSYPA